MDLDGGGGLDRRLEEQDGGGWMDGWMDGEVVACRVRFLAASGLDAATDARTQRALFSLATQTRPKSKTKSSCAALMGSREE
jgi:hypothetical protein